MQNLNPEADHSQPLPIVPLDGGGISGIPFIPGTITGRGNAVKSLLFFGLAA